jgi:hypothetical protein
LFAILILLSTNPIHSTLRMSAMRENPPPPSSFQCARGYFLFSRRSNIASVSEARGYITCFRFRKNIYYS